MFSRTIASLAAVALTTAAAFALLPASANVPAGTALTKTAGQGFSYDVGSKHTVGYFMETAGACALTLMVAERVDLDVAMPTPGARLRVNVAAGQDALLETGEGAGVSVSCAPDAASIKVQALLGGA